MKFKDTYEVFLKFFFIFFSRKYKVIRIIYTYILIIYILYQFFFLLQMTLVNQRLFL